jgi:hypothetical protein
VNNVHAEIFKGKVCKCLHLWNGSKIIWNWWMIDV